MKNLKKLTKKNLKSINGGGEQCPPAPTKTCDKWCRLTPWQKIHCLLDVEEPCTCF
ncbi:bacteriocin-like protein [Chryseobacterium sp. MEBOG06]|uniref:bacteriocin-like protein n=1 Tax=Chryseobacterium sp. MEBOG06 TaxID=2879938 RepID=UPI00397867DB